MNSISSHRLNLPRRLTPAVACLSVALGSLPVDAAESSLVYPGTDGRLVYATWSVRGQTNSVNKIPDFSYAGYKGGGVAIPLVPVRATVNPVTGDDSASIQAAIDQVAALTPDANGIRGAVLLNAGTYDCANTLFIRTSGVVLRGQGNLSSGGTRIRNTSASSQELAVVRLEGTDQRTNTNQTNITSAYVAVGSRTLTVASASAYAVGDTIAIVRTPNQTWIDLMGTSGFDTPWTTTTYTIMFERKVTAKSGNTLTFDAPLTHVIETQYGGGYVTKFSNPGRIQNVGVENIWMEGRDSTSADTRAHFAVETEWVDNAWIRDVTGRYLQEGFRLGDGSKHVTLQDCAAIEFRGSYSGSFVYPYRIEYHKTGGLYGGGYNLIQRCYADEARHSYVPGPRLSGPDVILDVLSRRDIEHSGPHQRYASGQLMDNLSVPRITVNNRGNGGTGHGWCGAQNVVWNSLADESDYLGTVVGAGIYIDAPPGAMNFEIGCRTINGAGAGTNNAFYESRGTHVATRSLYLKQLSDRLGTTAVNNVTTAGQRTGTLWAALRSWAGNGNFTPGGYGGGGSGVLLADDFEDGNANGWTVVEGPTTSWSIFQDGATKRLKCSDTTGGSRIRLAGSAGWTNYTYEIDVKCDTDGTDDFPGVLFRAQDASNFYMLQLRMADNTVRLYKRVAGTYTQIGTSPTQTLAAGTVYLAKVVVSGTSIKTYVNNVLKHDLTDTTYAGGQVGVRSYNAATAFDDVTVLTP